MTPQTAHPRREERPLLAITMGDPSGVGPEVTVKALADGSIHQIARPLVIGDRRVLAEAAKVCGLTVEVRAWRSAEEATFEAGSIDVLDLDNVSSETWRWGQLSAESGKAALEYIRKAMTLTDSGVAKGIVTAPINKEATSLAGSKELGHMELFARVYDAKNQATMLVSGKLRCVHLTTHEDFRRWGMAQPRIAVSAINPHGGEGGLMGTEEQEHMTPAVQDAKRMGIDARGPYPADSVYVRAMRGEFDAVIAMFHDQGHIPVKVHGFEQSVSVALGLPIVRTSVDHGTAFDIAGKGIADELSMRESIRVAAEICAGTWLQSA